MYSFGWGQLNADQNDIDSKVQWNNLQLDIVGFLAILGESAVVSTSQVATLSRMIYIPRLLPAPQALLQPSRPENLSPIAGQAIGVTSGNLRQYVNFLGHVLANADGLPDYAVKCIQIKRKNNAGEVKARTFGPTWWTALLGATLSLALFGIAIGEHDGMAMLADICLSFLSTLVGIVNKWNLNLPKRAGDNSKNHWTPPGDVIIRYPKGSFVVIRCSEDVARELFFAPEGIEYQVEEPWKYRMIALVGSILLMFGVIFLGNAKTNCQVAFAVSYMILNAAYWVIAALPKRFHWDTRAFEVIPEAFDEEQQSYEKIYKVMEEKAKSEDKEFNKRDIPKTIPKESHCKQFVAYHKTFTQALWKVIIATRETDWIRRSDAAPNSDAWDKWLDAARLHATDMKKAEFRDVADKKHRGKTIKVQHYGVPSWNAQAALGSFLNAAKAEEVAKAMKRTAENRTASDLQKKEEV